MGRWRGNGVCRPHCPLLGYGARDFESWSFKRLHDSRAALHYHNGAHVVRRAITRSMFTEHVPLIPAHGESGQQAPEFAALGPRFRGTSGDEERFNLAGTFAALLRHVLDDCSARWFDQIRPPPR